MSFGSMNRVVQRIRQVVVDADDPCESDADLLGRFLSHSNSHAVSVLIRRHAPMVWGVCRRILFDHHDAEDAFQATFLVLLRKANAIKPRSMVGNWLHGVALQTALKARTMTMKRNSREKPMASVPDPASKVTGDHPMLAFLDEELNRLPDKYRLVLVLCDLQRKTRAEAAKELGWAEGTVASRLARGRQMLGKGLGRRGTVVSAAAISALLANNVASAAPASVVASTVQAAVMIVSAKTMAAAGLSQHVITLADGVVKTMFLTKLKLAMVLLLVAGLIIGASGMIFQMQAAEQKTEKTDTEKRAAAGRVAKDAIALQAGEGKGGDAAQDSGAEKLYRAMEKKVRGAKSLHVALDGEVDLQAIKGTVKATIYATQGNKSRIEIDFDIDGKADKLLFLTDGKVRYTKQGDKGTLDPNPQKAEQEGKLVPGTIARIGITGAILMARSVKPGEEKEVDLDKDAPVTNFKLGAKEMVGDKTAQVVTYKLDFDGTSAEMSVWIDTKTQLPLKRVVAVDQDGQVFRITETYSTFAIDPKLDPKLFEIPKE